MKTVFQNEAFDKAIKDYLSFDGDIDGKIYNSFLVVVMRMLVNIYGELDIVNPYLTFNSEALDHNLMKYGASQELVNEFKLMLDMYYKIELKKENSVKKEGNPYFIDVQKKLIDMFILKKNNVDISDSDYSEFFNLLYTPATDNPLRLSYNYLLADDVYEVATYFQESVNNSKHVVVKKNRDDLLDLSIYKMFDYKLSDISMMNNDELKQINSGIYSALNINENAINKEYLLNEAIRALKGEDNKVTTGNGYVDILLIMSVVVTCVMVVSIFAFIVF